MEPMDKTTVEPQNLGLKSKQLRNVWCLQVIILIWERNSSLTHPERLKKQTFLATTCEQRTALKPNGQETWNEQKCDNNLNHTESKSINENIYEMLELH